MLCRERPVGVRSEGVLICWTMGMFILRSGMNCGGSLIEKWCDQALFEERTWLKGWKVRWMGLVICYL